jgi:hypothetical protein
MIATLAAWLDTVPALPCDFDNKRPITPRGFYDAKVTTAWRNYPLVGLRTGAASGIDCLDIDLPSGWDWLSEHEHLIPLTTWWATRRGGYHFLFQHHEGLRNSAGRIAAGVDTRGDGGYCICWALQPGALYGVGPIAPWSDWLIEKLAGTVGSYRLHPHARPCVGVLDHMQGSERPVQPIAAQPTRNLGKRATHIIGRIARAKPGNRNNYLFWGAVRMGEIMAEGRIKREIAEHLLRGAAQTNGLWAEDRVEVELTIASGIETGARAASHEREDGVVLFEPPVMRR